MIALTTKDQSLIAICTGTTPAVQFTITTEEFTKRKVGNDFVHVCTTVAASTTSTAESVLIAAPAAGGRKIVRRLTARNTSGSNTVTVQLLIKDGATNFQTGPTHSLAINGALVYANGLTQIYNATGTMAAAA